MSQSDPPVESSPMPILSKVLRAGEGKTLKEFEAIVVAVNEAEAAFEPLTDEELKDKTIEFKNRLAGARHLTISRSRLLPPCERRRSVCSDSVTTTCR